MNKYICIHGHFYQPPRENPWLEEVELQDNAYPYHDWNERITAECYAPNAASRILDAEGKIVDIINIYTKISFDFGPTLLSWLERHKPDVYQSILEADRLSRERFSGHGSAMAQAYSHLIMPLANKRDKYTQIVWGIRDFQKRFKRFPEGMWLPEAAADIETLEIMAGFGIRYTLLSPRQAKRIREVEGRGKWNDVSGEKVDTTMVYLCILPSGKTINLFFYDGPISQDISFGELLNNGEVFAERLLSAFHGGRGQDQLVHIATDGETFGHHHRYGDMALSYCLHHIEAHNLARLTNYGEYLEKHPPTQAVEIFEKSSWSCIHGVERWRDNCGCNTGLRPDWTQAWRKPLRSALDWLRNNLILLYEDRAPQYFRDPWNARDSYIDVVLNRSRKNVEEFLRKNAAKKLSKQEKVYALKLLEMQRNAMLMYTSCGWFFDEVSGIEALQIMQYAAKAIQDAEELKTPSLNQGFIQHLRKAPSNVYESAAVPYEMFVSSARSNLLRVGAHYGISSIFEEYNEDTKIFCYTARSEGYSRIEGGKQKLAVGKATITSDITWDKKSISFVIVHLGDHNINAGVKDFTSDQEFSAMQDEMRGAFEKGDIPELIRQIDRHFDGNTYSLWHLFKDEQRKVLDQILQLTYESIENSYRHIYEDNYPIMSFFHNLNIQLPRRFSAATEYIVNLDLKKVFEERMADTEKLRKLIDEAQRWSIKIDKKTMGYVVSTWVNSALEGLLENPADRELLENIDSTLKILKPLSLSLEFWKAQNIYFSINKNVYAKMMEKASQKDPFAESWIEAFAQLKAYLHVKVL
jgi:alpha-amylase/alpha-mannosidase (GH57 family)